MSTTILGYNRDACDGSAVKIPANGVNVVDKNNDIIIIPAGYGIESIQVKLVNQASNQLSGAAAYLDLYLDAGTVNTTILRVSKLDLNGLPHVALIGTDASPISKVSNSAQILKMKSDVGDFGAAGPTVCVLIKMRPMPVL